MKRRRKLDSRAIVMLMFGLIAVIAIMVQMRRSLPQPPAELAALDGKRIGIVDSVYINRPFQFMIKRPNEHWQFEMLSTDSICQPITIDRQIYDHILWLVRGVRQSSATKEDSFTVTSIGTATSDTLVIAKIGILVDSTGMASKELAISLLAEMIARYEADGARVQILQQVTSPAHQLLKGDYFALVAPDNITDKPIIIYSILPRGDLFYVLSFQTNDTVYPEVRQELEEFVQRFHPLPSTIQ
jgi:hypothetical protein